jgi:hydrogenase-1 operon protein HyaF
MLDNHTPIATETAAPVSPFDDPECRYVALPETMQTFAPPPVPDWLHNPKGRAVLAQLAEGLSASHVGREATVIDLLAEELETRDFIGQLLGEGEISLLADKPGQRLTISEAVFAGVWRIRRHANGQLVQDYLETGPFPAILAEWSAGLASQASLPTAFPDNLMNAPPLAYEIFAKSAGFAPGSEEVINLSLLPLTAEDTAFLLDCLGLAGISILYRGYGDCQIRRTGLPNVWWVQYFNSPGQLILNTLEITALPKVVMAAPEDLEDSASRLREFLSPLRWD